MVDCLTLPNSQARSYYTFCTVRTLCNVIDVQTLPLVYVFCFQSLIWYCDLYEIIFWRNLLLLITLKTFELQKSYRNSDLRRFFLVRLCKSWLPLFRLLNLNRLIKLTATSHFIRKLSYTLLWSNWWTKFFQTFLGNLERNFKIACPIILVIINPFSFFYK